MNDARWWRHCWQQKPRSLIASGKKIIQDLYAIFRREQEEGVEPVVKEDVAEVLRRRLFNSESLKQHEAFRSHVVAALKGITNLDAQSKKAQKEAESRFLQSLSIPPRSDRCFLF